jgi:hypothetical protein
MSRTQRTPVSMLVANTPRRPKPRSTRAISVSAAGASNQCRGGGIETVVGQWYPLGRTVQALVLREPRREDSAHPLIGLYGDHAEPARDELAGHLAGPGREVKHPPFVPVQQP